MQKEYEVVLKRRIKAGNPAEAVRAFWAEVDSEAVGLPEPEVFEIVEEKVTE